MRQAVFLLFILAAAAAADVTYTRDVAPIMQAKCQQCHRPQDVAPFALMNYDDAVTWARDIKASLIAKTMPPWKPVPGFGEFQGSYALSDDEKNTLLAWIDSGMTQGDPADLPPPVPVSDSPWQLGDPDTVLTAPEFTPPPDVADTYRCFVMPSGLTDNRFIAAAQALPGNPQIVHHVLFFLDEIGEAEKFDGQDGQPGYNCFGGPNISSVIDSTSATLAGTDILHGLLLGGWVPGARTRRLPEDIGLPIPKNARIVMQVHYHPAGRGGSDQTQLGFWFADTTKIQHRLVNLPIANTNIRIPANDANHVETAKFAVPIFLSGKVITVAPHMHNLGRQITVEVLDRNGVSRPIIKIDDWDFNWQGFYEPVTPITIPGGSTVQVTSVYDNSVNNIKNPNDPIVEVRWGERTIDEMCLAFIGVILDNEAILQFPFNSGKVR
jgi:hypothetical protein